MKKTITKITSHRASRFGLLGVVNTGLDFIILNILRVSTHTTTLQSRKLVALNIISASFVAVFSFFMNKRFVFKNDDTHHTKVWVFIAITLSGIFLLQSAIISISLPLVTPLAEFMRSVFIKMHVPILSGATINFYTSNIAKVLATGATMVWNYTLYKKLIFKGRS